MISQRRPTLVVLTTLALAAGLPAATALAAQAPTPASAPPAAAAAPATPPASHASLAQEGPAKHHVAPLRQSSAVSDLRLASRDLAHGRRTAAAGWLERAETAALNDRSAMNGMAGDSGAGRAAALDKAIIAIKASRADTAAGKLPQAQHQTLAALGDLRGA